MSEPNTEYVRPHRRPVLNVEVRFMPWDWNWKPWRAKGSGRMFTASWLFLLVEVGLAPPAQIDRSQPPKPQA